MKSRNLILSYIAASLFSAGVMANTDKNTLTLSSQPIPLTTAVSPEFYEFSKNFPAANVEALQENLPKTESEWRSVVESRDKAAIERAKFIAHTLEVTIEKASIAGVDVYWVTPKTVAPELKDKLFVAIQGGAYMLNSGLASAAEASIIAAKMQIPVIAIDYTKSIDAPAPAARNDIITVWNELLKNHSAESIVMGGSSAGGSLTLAVTQELNKQALPIPSALYVGTPSVDMTMTGDSRYINEGLDHILGAWRGMSSAMVDVYVGDLELSDPVVSVINGSFNNFPPTYLITGTRDLLLSDTVRVHRELRRTGVAAELNVYEGQSHGDYAAAFGTPESNEHYQALSEFLYGYLVK
ncbi:alpha/beta hydrolase fold domain-containing protein [Vibrio alginolyticus]|uniref:alpha/beta hydrolase fold domain-containing protein n=1 Tax=Vibrio chagasii TaxID=170679 RepID=UPI001EFE2752|nr:alpha/beta hydrolase fold domain-containing protein [Vibrio chagasii]MCG9605218.1 alpha/beta hydrolase [Vibrio chagasii]MDE9380827.1 alpha/beta hydrolase fold domain-containing protein [Vibrio alginolyticus]CAH7042384.1 Abhydrolase_3 domain-containing protein [Vibrio chagasii]